MPIYEFSAWVTICADSVEEADSIASEAADTFSKSGDFSLSIDDGEPAVIEEDD